jgi:putative membrane protein
VQGGCERINNTPLPRQYDYDYFPELFIYIYCLLFPLSVVQDLGAFTPVLSSIITFVFLILNRIGKNLEDPFATRIYGTPLLAISRTIEINLLQQLGETDLPEPVQPSNGVLE